MDLIAEDLLLLLLDDESGRAPGALPVATVLGGALLVDLALADAVSVPAGDRDPVRSTGRTPGDPLLADALGVVAEKDRRAQDLVDPLGRHARDRLAERLVERGILERRDRKVLGLFPRTSWPEKDGAREAAVRERLESCLLDGATPDPRTATLVALLSAVGHAHRTIKRDGVPGKQVKRRAAEITEQLGEADWPAQAVRDAVQAAATAVAVMTATTAATTAATTN